MGCGFGWMFPERRRTVVREERRGILATFNAEIVKKDRSIPAGHLEGFYRAILKFRKFARLNLRATPISI